MGAFSKFAIEPFLLLLLFLWAIGMMHTGELSQPKQSPEKEVDGMDILKVQIL
jgi:hypothetical protein